MPNASSDIPREIQKIVTEHDLRVKNLIEQARIYFWNIWTRSEHSPEITKDPTNLSELITEADETALNESKLILTEVTGKEKWALAISLSYRYPTWGEKYLAENADFIGSYLPQLGVFLVDVATPNNWDTSESLWAFNHDLSVCTHESLIGQLYHLLERLTSINVGADEDDTSNIATLH